MAPSSAAWVFAFDTLPTRTPDWDDAGWAKVASTESNNRTTPESASENGRRKVLISGDGEKLCFTESIYFRSGRERNSALRLCPRLRRAPDSSELRHSRHH